MEDQQSGCYQGHASGKAVIEAVAAHDIIRQMSSTIAAMKQAVMPSLSMSSRVGMVMTLPFP
jgi:hypothetical protein